MKIAEDELARIRRWVEDVNTPLDRDALYFESILGDYALRCRENPDDGRKTISLPAGKIATRPGTARWSVDADTFLAWARDSHPDLIRVHEEPALAELKAALIVADDGGTAVTEDGEIVPGIEVHMNPTSVSIRPDVD